MSLANNTKPLVTIITVTKNSISFINKAIESVISQTYDNIEYIIVDGDSSDGTKEFIVQNYGKKISKFISEPDKGIYDAMNKGLSLASGEIIAFLNSDDFYLSEKVIENIVEQFNIEKDLDIVIGDPIFVDKNGQFLYRFYLPNKIDKFEIVAIGDCRFIPQPSTFLKKEVFEKVGYFDISYRSASDYEFFIRCLQKGVNIKFLKEPTTAFRIHGNNTSFTKIGALETKIISKNYLKKCFENLYSGKYSDILKILNMKFSLVAKFLKFRIWYSFLYQLRGQNIKYIPVFVKKRIRKYFALLKITRSPI